MEGKMKVAEMQGIGKMGYVEKDIPTPNADEVLVKLDYVGICGSDLHYYEEGRIGNYEVEFPFILGHEAGGVVVEVGEDVTHLHVGDKVALEPGKTCGHCEFCTSGRYNLCPEVVFFATPPVDGVFQEYVAHEAKLCFKVPDNMDTLEAAMVEPFSIGLHAARQGGAKFGQTAVVFGAGCIGLCTMMALKTQGVSDVYVIDLMDKRLEKAKELGAKETVSGKGDAVAEIMELTDGRGVDLVFDCTGSEYCVNQGIEMLVKGGRLVFVGYSSSGHMNINTTLLCDKELSLNSVFRYRHIYPLAIKAISEGQADVKGFVTNIFDFDNIQEAMDKSAQDKANIVKGVIKVSKDS